MNVLEAIRKRRSVRKYLDRPIPAKLKQKLLEALRLAPSACNHQPWRFILVEDGARRREIAQLAYNQDWMAKAPLIVVGCGFPEAAYQRMGGHGNSVNVDLAIAIDHLTLAAAEEGLGTCWIGAFAEDAVKKALGVPENVRIVAMTPVGYPAHDDALRDADPARRKSADEIFTVDSWK